jgi:hypothetical protein
MVTQGTFKNNFTTTQYTAQDMYGLTRVFNGEKELLGTELLILVI